MVTSKREKLKNKRTVHYLELREAQEIQDEAQPLGFCKRKNVYELLERSFQRSSRRGFRMDTAGGVEISQTSGAEKGLASEEVETGEGGQPSLHWSCVSSVRILIFDKW